MFITIEGPDGSGKSTQIKMLADFLRRQGRDVLATREPGGTLIGDQIRACLHDVANREMTAATEILLYSASRAQLVEEAIRPALAAGRIVLCDRYADSTMAYQGYGRGLDLDALRQITHFATGGLKPDLTLLLDMPVAEGLRRRAQNGQEMNRMDRQTLAFYERVRDGYHHLARQEPERWRIVDGAQPLAAVQAELQSLVSQRLGLA